MKKVYLSELVAQKTRDLLQERYEIVDNFDHPEEIEAIMIRQVAVTREVIEKCVNLKVISMHGIGLDRIDLEAAKEHGIPVFNVPGKGAQAVAELAVCYFMMLSRNVKKANIGLKQGAFKTFGPAELVGHEVQGKVLGVIGFGNISKCVIKMLHNGFDCPVKVYDPFASKETIESLGYEKIESVKELCQMCDFVSISVPLTDQTKNMINKEVLDVANPNLIIVNTARGGIVNEDDLYDALVAGKIAGAGLDVTVEEPIDKDNKLLTLENFVCSPHMGGSTYESRERVGEVAVEHIVQVLG